jgi:hypothetical protein
MGRKSEKQRAKQSKQKLAEKRKARINREKRAKLLRKKRKDRGSMKIVGGHSTPLMQNFGFENPFFGLDSDRRKDFAKLFGKDIDEKFQQNLKEFQIAIRNHDPIELLCTIAVYCSFKGIGPDTDHTDEGHYPQALIEAVQSLCLMVPEEKFGNFPILHGHMFELLDLAKDCSKQFGLRRIAELANVPEEQHSVLMAIEGARMQTQMLRNWGYPQHMRKISGDLFAPLSSAIEGVLGVSPMQLQLLFDGLTKLVNDRVFEYLKKMGPAFAQKDFRTTVRKFCELSETSASKADEIYNFLKSQPGSKQQKRFFLISFFHQFFPSLFTVSPEDCSQVLSGSVSAEQAKTVLKKLSFRFGDLSDANPEHLLMQSPIQKRPFIEFDEEEFILPIPGMLNSFYVEILESIIYSDKKLKKRYHKRRAEYLEDEIESLASTAFPNCLLRTGTKWTDKSSGKRYENDCLVVCGPLALVFEAKSERVDDVAKRGGTNTLKGVYDSLISEPAEQATRLARLLEDGEEVTTFETDDGGEYELDLSTIRKAICVSVTLDTFPATSLCWQQMLEAGLVSNEARPSISMDLSDLLVTLDVLDTPAVCAHYFWRRSEWEQNMKYFGDEGDLLVYYLSEGLPVLQNDDGEHLDGLMIYGNSAQLHRYYMAEWSEPDNVPAKPMRILTDWFKSILDKVVSSERQDKWDVACVLLDLSYERQVEFEKQFQQSIAAVKKEGNYCGREAVTTWANHTESLGAVIALAYDNLPNKERNDLAADIAGQTQAEADAIRVVVLGKNVAHEHWPYDFLAFAGSRNF